jgi:hypothetical protein
MLTDPYAIFAAAQQYWQSAVYPQHASYAVAVTVTHNGVTSQAHYHAHYDPAQNRVTIDPVSDEELAHPYTPHGINVVLSLFQEDPHKGIPLSSPQRTFDYLGVPVLAPNYSFGIVPAGIPVNTAADGMALVQEIRREFHDPAPPRKPQAKQSDLKTIAAVVVAHRQYNIALKGIEPLDGHTDYHLLLSPIAEPNVYRLRDMWVDTSTYATDRLITDGNFTAPQLGGVRWQIDYVQISQAPFIAREIALSGFTLERRHYDSAAVAFTGISPSGSTAWLPSLPRFATNAETAPPVLSEPSKPRA